MKTTLADALSDTVRRYQEATPRSRDRHEQSCRAMPGGNTRTILHYDPYPVTITRGEGCTVWDLDDNRYTDFLGEYSAGLYGHSNPRITAAIKDALDQGIVLCAPNRYEFEFADLICGRFPSCDQVRFCNSGTEANLLAVSAARTYTARAKIMVFNGAYHGSVFYFGRSPSPINAPFEFVVGTYNDAEICTGLAREHQHDLAAILVEPLQGSGGCIPSQRGFLQRLRDVADDTGAVLIFDEVMTSRLSPGGLQQTMGIVPDMTTFGKYLGGGLTFGAFGGKKEIMAQFDPRRPEALAHAGTFNNNVLTMIAGLTGLRDIYTDRAAIDHNRKGDDFRTALQAAIDRRGLPMHVSGAGSLLCIHFQRGPIDNIRDSSSDPRLRSLLQLEMMLSGVYLANRGFMSLSLALAADDHAHFLMLFEQFMDNYSEQIAEHASPDGGNSGLAVN